MKVPWRRVASWHCVACGKCCRAFRVRLNAYEYLKLKHTGFVEERGGKFYIKKIDGLCPFQVGSLCALQDKLKPIACRLYPFSIYERGSEDATFEYGGETYYVYVDTFCRNVKLGKAGADMMKIVEEAVKMHRREISQPQKLTADLGASGLQRLRRRPARV
ncbi:MAG: YkgJ family cysteine cluster protein [Archaeoglobaceae archaeon]